MTVNINLMVAVAIVLLNLLYVSVRTGCQILHFILLIHFPDVVAYICVEAVPIVPHELPFYNNAFD